MKRNEIQEKYLWKISDIYESDEAWEKAFHKVETCDFSAYHGTLNNADSILTYFHAQEKYEIDLLHVYLYAYMKHDEDVSVSKYASAVARVISLLSRYGSETAFAVPEITALDEEKLLALSQDEKLKDYDYVIRRMIAEKKHILSEKEERILAEASEPLSTAGEVFDVLNNVELDFPEIEYEGKKVQLSHGMYGVIINGNDREKRKEAFKSNYAAYKKILGTLSVTYYGNVKQDIFIKNVRGFDSCLSMALFNEDVDPVVYHNLIDCVNNSTHLMHRYMRLRKKLMGVDELHMYDVGPSLVQNADLKLSYEDAYELVVNGLAPLGKEYQEVLKKAKEERWLDVYESEGKKSGAYSIGLYGVHPYVLLNYQGITQDIFAIAHEMGHSMHTYFSAKSQPYSKADYKIFVAEVASTVNEVLLVKHLIRTSEDKNLKRYLVNYFLDLIRTTLFRQTQFAEFEEAAHAMAERGEPLTKDNLSAMYFDINKKYYGDAVTYDDEISYEWARIPHLYHSFYVYKYATGITAAVAIADKLLSEGENAVKNYFEFLSSGSKTDPVSLLKIAGVDLTQKTAFESVMKEFEAALDELEGLSE